jgi:hypothetical protein
LGLFFRKDGHQFRGMDDVKTHVAGVVPSLHEGQNLGNSRIHSSSPNGGMRRDSAAPERQP